MGAIISSSEINDWSCYHCITVIVILSGDHLSRTWISTDKWLASRPSKELKVRCYLHFILQMKDSFNLKVEGVRERFVLSRSENVYILWVSHINLNNTLPDTPHTWPGLCHLTLLRNILKLNLLTSLLSSVWRQWACSLIWRHCACTGWLN